MSLLKMHPFFLVQIALTSQHFHNQQIDFNDFTFDATLLYDSDGPTEKHVDFVKIKPVDHKPTVNETGDQVTIELRIKVLTSQHENSFFRVKISLLDPNTGLPYQPPLVCYSDPVKVISKPEQVKKKPATSTNVPVSNSKKRTVNDLLLETISRIEDQQREHQQMIEKLLRASENNYQNKSPPTQQIHIPHIQQLPISPQQIPMYEHQQLQRHASITSYPNDGSLLYQLPNIKQTFPENLLSDPNCQSPNNSCVYSPPNPSLANCTAEESEFENAFRKFFKVYTRLSEEEKPMKIRKLIRSSSQREAEKISEFLDLFQTEGFHKSGDIVQKNSPCQNPTCPYQNEINELNDFYDQILTFPPQFE